MRGSVIEVHREMLAEVATGRGRLAVCCPSAVPSLLLAAEVDPGAPAFRSCEPVVRRLPTGRFAATCPDHGTLVVERGATTRDVWLAAAYFGGWEPKSPDAAKDDLDRWVFDEHVEEDPYDVAWVDAHLVITALGGVNAGTRLDAALWCCPIPGLPTWGLASRNEVLAGKRVRMVRLRPCERCVANRAAHAARSGASDVDWADAAAVFAEEPW